MTAFRRWEPSRAWCSIETPFPLADTDHASALREALDELRELDAVPAAARVTRRLRELGERAVPRGPRPAT